MASAVIWYESDGYRPEGREIMGRRVAGQGFLTAYARYARTEQFSALVRTREDQDEFAATMRRVRPEIPVNVLTAANMGDVANTGCLYFPGPTLQELSWVRRFFAPVTWSLCGVTHTISEADAMKTIAGWPMAAFEPWDAVICTSKAVKDAVQRVLEASAAHLLERLGATRVTLPHLPIIPLGVDCDRQADIMCACDTARSGLGIGEGDFVVLFVGRLAFNAKANPFPMYLALERLATRHKVVMVECGWPGNDAIAEAFAKTRAEICPSVRSIVLDGRIQQELARAWASADCFCSLSDNIQETFGLTPIEAMAAGLPCVVSDWNGYRDTVRDGVDGFRVPTLAPPSGFATDFIVDHVLQLRPYGAFIGDAAAITVVDCEAAASAFERLAADAELRRRLGANGVQRAREAFDWSVVIRAHEALWDELAEIRTASARKRPGQASPVRWPEHLDPFDMFAGYPTSLLQAKSKVRLTPDAETEAFELRLTLPVAFVGVVSRQPLEAFKQLRDQLRGGPYEIEAFLRHYRASDRVRAMRGLMLMAKFGLVAIEA